ncbi:MAG: FAD:protein FMN transferase [Pirellulaceae bacterium]
MKTFVILLGAILFSAALTAGGGLDAVACAEDAEAGDRGASLGKFQSSEIHMGVDFTIVLYAPDQEAANRAFRAAFERIEQLNKVMSDYDPQSELSRLSDASPTKRPIPISDDLLRVLHQANAWSEKTDGAFDVTVGPLVRLWRRARRRGELPSRDRLDDALASVGYRHLRLDAQQKTAEMLRSDMLLDLGGIAKGYAVDEALETLRGLGLRRALVNGSGDLAAGDPPPDKSAWSVGVAPLDAGGKPSLLLRLANQAVATSGDAFQYVEIDGRRYSHIVDPRTGLGLSDHSSVTIVAPNCMTADALASSVSVLGPEKGIALVERTAEAAALIVRAPEGTVETHRSKRFKAIPHSIPRSEDGAVDGGR